MAANDTMDSQDGRRARNTDTPNETPPNPNLIRLTHWDDNYAGDYDMNRDVLRLFHRGAYKEYPLMVLIERYRKRRRGMGTQGDGA